MRGMNRFFGTLALLVIASPLHNGYGEEGAYPYQPSGEYVARDAAAITTQAAPSLITLGNLTWETSRNDAMTRATNEGKLVLLIAGRETCPNTRHMRDTVCELDEPPIRAVIVPEYVPWFCNIDFGSEWSIYAGGLGSFTLPLIVCINPAFPDTMIDRTTAIQDSNAFYIRLLINAGLPTPPPSADVELNGASFGTGSRFTATFQLNGVITRPFDVYAVVNLPDGTMRDAITLTTKINPVAANVNGLPAGFRYPFMSLTIPQGAPKGNCSVMVGFFDPDTAIHGPQDAFLLAAASFTLQ